MSTPVIDMLLTIAVVASWLGAAGFARLRSPLDRLHCVGFVNVAVNLPIVAAAFVGDGLSDRSAKLLLIAVLMLLTGAATAHAAGRALMVRASTRETGTP